MPHQSTIQFINALGYTESDRLNFRALFPKGDDRSKIDNGRKCSGTLSQCEKQLRCWESEGRDVYMVINRGGHKKEAIIECPAAFCEWDNLSIEIQKSLPARFGLKPALQVWTGNKSIHTYFVFDKPIKPEDWEKFQVDLNACLSADESIKDLPRIMRVPGFKNQATGETVKIVGTSDKRYSFEEFRELIPPQKVSANVTKAHVEQCGQLNQAADMRELAAYLIGYSNPQNGNVIKVQCPLSDSHGEPPHSEDSLHIFQDDGRFKPWCGCDTKAVYHAALEVAVSKGFDAPQVRAIASNDDGKIPEKKNYGSNDESLDSEEKSKRKSCADILIELGMKASLFHDSSETCYADIEIDGDRHTYPINSTNFRRWLGREYFQLKGKAPNHEALRSALGVLEGEAFYNGPEIETHLRTAKHDGRFYLDLGNDRWQAVEIDSQGWRIVGRPPIRFIRPTTLGPLPTPNHDGSLEQLKKLLNVDNDAWVLLVTFLLFSFIPDMTYPVLLLSASRGSGKTTIAEFIKSLIDPGKAPLISLSSDEHRLAVAAQRRWMVAYDNISRLSPMQSDALCKLATGFGFSTRTLHTTDEETVFELARPQILTAIDHIVTRDDLADRLLMVQLPPISPKSRLKKSELDAKLEGLKPSILGALLTALSQTLAALPNTNTDHLPRMADYGHFAIASETPLGLEKDAFWKAFNANREASREIVLEASPLAESIRKLVDRQQHWQGTASQLLEGLEQFTKPETVRSKYWPKTSASLGKQLNRLAQDLEIVGVKFESERKNKTRVITLIKRVENSEHFPSLPSLPSPTELNPNQREDSRGDSRGDSRVTGVTASESYRHPTVTGSDSSDSKGDSKNNLLSPLEPSQGEGSDSSDGSDGKKTPSSDGSEHDWEDLKPDEVA